MSFTVLRNSDLGNNLVAANVHSNANGTKGQSDLIAAAGRNDDLVGIPWMVCVATA